MSLESRSLVSLLLLLFQGCDRSGSAAHQTSGTAAQGPRWNIDSELVRRYGVLPGPGKTTRADGLETKWKVCARETFASGSVPTTWVAVCGSAVDASHAQSGWIDLLVSSDSQAVFRVVAETTGLETGSFGEPGEVSFVRIGRERPAFALSSDYSGMGSMIETVDWYGLEGPRLRQVLSTRLLASDEGQTPCDEDSLACRWERRQLGIDSTDPRMDRFPVRVLDSARSQGAIRTATTTVAFRADSGRYVLPDPLMPDFW